MILNNAPAIYMDGKMVERVYSDGELVWGLPKGYKRCKYLESSGNQYIDTGYKPTQRTTIEVVVENAVYEYYNCIATVRNSTTSEYFGIQLMPSGKIRALFENSIIGGAHGEGYPVILTQKNKMSLGGGVFLVNDVQLGSVEPTSFMAKYSLPLFANNTAGTISQEISCRMYYANIFDDNELYRGFIPVLDPSNRPCMFDTVTKQPFYNKGTGEFGYELVDGTYVAPI